MCCLPFALEGTVALSAGDEKPAGSQGETMPDLQLIIARRCLRHDSCCVIEKQLAKGAGFLLFCECAGRPAAEAVHSGGIDTADEARASQSQHDQG